jgi:hypothetical protein
MTKRKEAKENSSPKQNSKRKKLDVSEQANTPQSVVYCTIDSSNNAASKESNLRHSDVRSTIDSSISITCAQPQRNTDISSPIVLSSSSPMIDSNASNLSFISGNHYSTAQTPTSLLFKQMLDKIVIESNSNIFNEKTYFFGDKSKTYWYGHHNIGYFISSDGL